MRLSDVNECVWGAGGDAKPRNDYPFVVRTPLGKYLPTSPQTHTPRRCEPPPPPPSAETQLCKAAFPTSSRFIIVLFTLCAQTVNADF